MRNATVNAFYHSPEWDRCRTAYISRCGGLCEDCLKQGIYKPGRVVHHKTHITPDNVNDPSITLNFDNLKYVCQDCHAKEHHPDSAKRYKFDALGNLIPLEGESPP